MKANREQFVYMMVTKGKFELPVAIADSVKELAAIVGVSYNTVRSVLSKAKNPGRYHISRSKYICVRIDEED